MITEISAPAINGGHSKNRIIEDWPVKLADRSFDDMRAVFNLLERSYFHTWGLRCALTDARGRIETGTLACAAECTHGTECAGIRRRAIEQSSCWGEAFLLECPRGPVVWAVPVMINALILGGLVVAVPEIRSPGVRSSAPTPATVHRAAADLLALAVEANLTNGSLLEYRQAAARFESDRAHAIHGLKDHAFHSIQDIYRVEEPALIMAVKRGDRARAREILNRVLASIYFLGSERLPVLKSFLLELVVMMSRSAVEAGGEPAELLGANYSSFAELAQIETEEALCAWLVSTLERIMDAINAHQRYPISALLDVALDYLRAHLQDAVSRDEVAAVACLSPSHFSRMVKRHFGQSFTELLARMRVEAAGEMLNNTEKSLLQICLDCGVSDQSYFTKVFHKYTGHTPGEYRRLFSLVAKSPENFQASLHR